MREENNSFQTLKKSLRNRDIISLDEKPIENYPESVSSKSICKNSLSFPITC
jgi:hypothetical protein